MKITSKHQLEGTGIKQMSCPKNKDKFATGNLDTIVIHYTAGRDAESSAKFLCSEVKASAHLVIGRGGEIIQLVPFDTIAWHAGESAYGSRQWLNKFSIGIELDNAGMLEKVGNEYKAWFGRKYSENDVLLSTHRNETKPAYWHTFTEEQIAACQQVCTLLIKKYGIRLILGHEEIAPGRKQDPGPAFPLDKFRDNLLTHNRSDEPDMINQEGLVIADLLNIRADAGVTFDKIAPPLKKGTEVIVLEERNGWYKVETKITGWVSKANIELKQG
jgi:N-acetylmuramoyl-L-alanine amidase